MTTLLLLGVSGVFAGIVNTLAGGGSFVSLAALIFIGLPADMANATNRVAVLLQSGVSTEAFRRAGQFEGQQWWLIPVTCGGAAIGAATAVFVQPNHLQTVIGVAMLAMLVWMLFAPQSFGEAGEPKREGFTVRGALAMGCVGVYAGFLQAGVGIVMLAVMVFWLGHGVVEATATKVSLIFVWTIPALTIFALSGLVDWRAGIVLGVGAAIGGWVGAKLTLWGGAGLIRWVLIAVLAVSSVRLLSDGLVW